MRPPQVKLAALLEQPHPAVDLKLDEYEKSTRAFLDSVSAYKARAMQVISDRTAGHVAETRRILEKIKAVEAETDQCKLKEIEMLAGECRSYVRGSSQ
jgi:kinetochore protein Spc25